MTAIEQPTLDALSHERKQEYGRDMHIGVLGPVEVTGEGVLVPLGGPKQRATLGLLVCELGRVVPVDALIEGLWGDEPTPGARSTLQTYVSNLRATLGDIIVREGGGYRLQADPHWVDAVQFEEGVARATALTDANPAEAAQRLRAALALWRGRPYADVSESFPLELEARRLEELRLAAVEARIEAELAMGLHAELVAELSVLSAEYPLREGFCAQSMLALYRSGRQAEALHAYQKTRSYLVEELGLDASTKLRELEHRILNHDSSLFLEIEPRVETLAFLLTDIENSTVLWELQTEQMRSALERHDEVVFGAIEAVGGGSSSESATASTSPSRMSELPWRRPKRFSAAWPLARCSKPALWPFGWRSTWAKSRVAEATTSGRSSTAQVGCSRQLTGDKCSCQATRMPHWPQASPVGKRRHWGRFASKESAARSPSSSCFPTGFPAISLRCGSIVCRPNLQPSPSAARCAGTSCGRRSEAATSESSTAPISPRWGARSRSR